MSYKGLCIGSGGSQGLVIAGALQDFYYKDLLHSITHYAGTSVGSIICYLLAIGYNPLDILEVACDQEFSNLFSHPNFLNIAILHGIYSPLVIKNKLVELTMNKLGFVPTFNELNYMGKYLIITGYKLSGKTKDERCVFFTPETHPDMKIVEAVCISCSIPLIFQKSFYQNELYIDGAYNTMLPINKLQEIINKVEDKENNRILTLYLSGSQRDTSSLFGYLLEILYIPLRDQDNLNNLGDNVDIIKLEDYEEVKSFNLSIDAKTKLEMFKKGYKSINKDKDKDRTTLDNLSKLVGKQKVE